MIKSEHVTDVPDELLNHLGEYARTRSIGHLKSCLAVAVDNRYITDGDGRPILLVWGYRPTLLSAYIEMGMVASEYFNARHAKACRPLVWEWIRQQSLPVYAACDTKMTARFLKFIGFTPMEELDGKLKYEALYQ